MAKTTLSSLLLGVVVLLSLAALRLGDHPESNQAATVLLPVEVIGADGFVTEATLPLSNPSKAKGLYLLVNNLSHDGKASVSINDGPWIDLTNDAVDMPEKDRSFGGIGGALGSIRLTVPVASNRWKSGDNAVRFRFNYEAGSRSSGYRVVQMNVVDAGGKNLVSPSAFQDENPDTWSPPLPTNSDINAGRDLWYDAQLKESPESGAPNLKAKCASCHAEDGRDLKYFNYSNQSISARAEFHGLSKSEGEQIASYIRSLDVPNPGRPWNPPYQPGPGLDSKPLSHWAAGAGLDAVLENDADIVGYLFPNGIKGSAIATHKTTNMREIPLSLQLPDWKHWLPTIHPIDAWGNDFENDQAHQKYLDFRAWALNASHSELRELFGKKLGVWHRRMGKDFLPDGRSYSDNPTRKGAEKAYSARLWLNVKAWELMQQFELEGLVGENTDEYGSHGESRSWDGGRILFDTAPHVNKIPSDHRGIGGTEVSNIYFSAAWYHLQVIMNAGNRVRQQTSPVDWNYQFNHTNMIRQGVPAEPMRFVLSLIKAMQMMDNEHGIQNPSKGWTPGYADIQRLVTGSARWDDAMATLPPTIRAQVSTAVLEAWFEKTNSVPISEWPRTPINGSPTIGQYPADGYKVFSKPEIGFLVDELWSSIPDFEEIGVDADVLQDIVDWASQMWPKNDWASLIEGGVSLSAAETMLLEEFTATVDRDGIRLDWTTPKIGRPKGYQIQRVDSPDGTWTTIGELKPRDGQKYTSVVVYQFVDNQIPLADSIFYRLRHQAKDGTVYYSRILTVEIPDMAKIDVAAYPNPVRSSTTIDIRLQEGATVLAELFNSSGQRVLTLNEGFLPKGKNALALDVSELSTGLYLLHLKVDEGLTTTTSVVVAR